MYRAAASRTWSVVTVMAQWPVMRLLLSFLLCVLCSVYCKIYANICWKGFMRIML